MSSIPCQARGGALSCSTQEHAGGWGGGGHARDGPAQYAIPAIWGMDGMETHLRAPGMETMGWPVCVAWDSVRVRAARMPPQGLAWGPL